MKFAPAHPRKPRLEPDLIPLINIIFMLLFFFVVAGTMKENNPLNVDIPNATQGDVTAAAPLKVTLARGGRVMVNDEPISSSAYTERLKSFLAIEPSGLIAITADQRLPAHSLIKLIQITEKAGAVNIALEIESTAR